jgi:hypothetical protein
LPRFAPVVSCEPERGALPRFLGRCGRQILQRDGERMPVRDDEWIVRPLVGHGSLEHAFGPANALDRLVLVYFHF